MSSTPTLFSAFLAGFLLLGFAVEARSQTTPQPLTPDQALALAIENNPDLQSLRIDLERADLLVEREETARTPTFTADAGYRYGQTPDLSAQGTRLIDSSSLSLSSRLSHTLPIGTQLAISAALNRSARDSVVLGDLGVAYDTSLGLDVTHPILRGAGRDLIDAPIRSARLSRQALEASRDASTSAVIREVMTTYWDLWLASRSIEIQREALEIARQSLRNAEIRRDAGTLATAELATLRIEIAAAEERVMIAESNIRQRSTSLAILLGQDPSAQFSADSQAPETTDLPDLDTALAFHREHNPELLQRALQIEDARIQAQLAENQALPRLDAIGTFSLGGLDRDLPGSLTQMGRFEGWVAFAGLRLELPIHNRSRRADAERAHLAVEAAELQYEQLESALAARIITALEQAETARTRVEYAETSAELTRQNVDAQNARFEVGRGTTLEVVDALQRHREAEERIVEARVELERHLLTIAEITGRLL